ncbi:sterol desaturase family protein [Flavitalea flava]
MESSSFLPSIREIFSRTIGFSLVYYFIIAGSAFVLFYLLLNTRVVKNKIQKKSASRKDFVREILHSMQSTIVMNIITIGLMFSPLRKYTLVYTEISTYGVIYLIVSVALALIIHDTYFYWMHRLLHHPRLFKHAHLLHHRSTNPSPWTSYSFHFLEAFTEGAIMIILVFVLPLHPLAITLFILIGFGINVYGHLGYEIMPRGLRKNVLFEIINTSVHHNLHHSQFKGNYGLYFRVWDRMMGTENPDYVKSYDKVQEQRFGV